VVKKIMIIRLISVFMIHGLCLGLAVTAGAQNLVTNPGFESGTSGWYGSGCDISTSTSVYRSGTHSGYASNRTDTWNSLRQSMKDKMEVGKTYAISGWMRLEGAASDNINMAMRITDDSGTSYPWIDASTGYDDQWTELMGYFTVDVNGALTALDLYFEGPADGVDYYLDDVNVVEIEAGDWKDEANDRIEQIRKGDFRITVVSPNDPNVVIPDVNVQVIQTKHSFPFGSEISWPQMDNSRYLSFFNDHFNWAVMGNSSKWYHNEPAEDYVTYTDADKIYDFCQANGITMRGHCLYWGVDQFVQDWIKNLSYAPLPATSELRTAVENRMDSAMNHFKGKFVHWDINNEMLHGSFYKDRLGDDIRPWMFQAAHAIDPNCKLFVNDYNVVSSGQTEEYKTHIQDLLDNNAPIHDIGAQCHFWGSSVEPLMVYDRLESLAQIGLPIWCTEYDFASTDEYIRADGLEKFYRTAFSHPSVEGILMFGYWEGQHWRDDCYIVNSDWTLNEAGLRYEELLGEWTTNDSNITDSNGNADLRGFYGTYEVTLTPSGGNSEVHNIELTETGGTSYFTLQLGTGTLPDNNAPVVEPFTWQSPPQAVAADTVTMTAVEANDISGVQYYFDNVTDPNHNSGWQDSNFYADVELTPNTNYTYRFKVRDKSTQQNETPFSDTATVRTLASGGNIITNAGFEAATIIGWTKWDGDFTAVTDQAHSGNYSGLFEVRFATWLGPVQDITDKVIDGKTYQCSAWVRLDNSTSEYVSISMKQVDGGGTSYHTVATGTAYNNQWIKLAGLFILDVNSTIEELSLYISGPAVDVNFYVDDVVVKTDPINCTDVQQFGFALTSDLIEDCYVNFADLKLLVDYWPSEDCAAHNDCDGADFEPDGDVDFVDFRVFALQWMWCNNPEDPGCAPNW